MSDLKEPYPEESTDIDEDENTISDIDLDLDTDLKTENTEVEAPPIVDIKYNDHAQRAYKKYNFPIPPEVDQYERRFLEDVDIRNGPIKRQVYKVIRCRAQDRTTGKTKDYLYYFERWDAFDYLGNELPPVAEHIEGKYDEVQIKYSVDTKTGRPIKSDPKPRGKRTIYYIPFSKQTLDRIIKGIDRETLEFIVKIGTAEKGFTSRDNTFSYEQFANLGYDQLIKLHFQPGGPRATPYVANVSSNKK